tara:strand:+ start:3076 stop:3249 length:174 start_codon:yes stop_codon:yes gene_type:complete
LDEEKTTSSSLYTCPITEKHPDISDETRHSYIPEPMEFDRLDHNRGVAIFKRKLNFF